MGHQVPVGLVGIFSPKIKTQKDIALISVFMFTLILEINCGGYIIAYLTSLIGV